MDQLAATRQMQKHGDNIFVFFWGKQGKKIKRTNGLFNLNGYGVDQGILKSY